MKFEISLFTIGIMFAIITLLLNIQNIFLVCKTTIKLIIKNTKSILTFCTSFAAINCFLYHYGLQGLKLLIVNLLILGILFLIISIVHIEKKI